MTKAATLIAYHGDPAIKDYYLARVRAHRAADELVAGVGWENGKGCAVGCTLDSYAHSRYPKELGIPQHLAFIQDSIFEALARTGEDHLAFPELFLSAIMPGADLSMVWPRFAYALLSDNESPVVQAMGESPQVREAVGGVATLYDEWVGTGVQPSSELFASAARAAAAAAMGAAEEAEEAEEAGESEASAASALAGWAGAAAARAAEGAAEAEALEEAAAAAGVEEAEAWNWMRDLLLRLLSEAPMIKAEGENQ